MTSCMLPGRRRASTIASILIKEKMLHKENFKAEQILHRILSFKRSPTRKGEGVG